MLFLSPGPWGEAHFDIHTPIFLEPGMISNEHNDGTLINTHCILGSQHIFAGMVSV